MRDSVYEVMSFMYRLELLPFPTVKPRGQVSEIKINPKDVADRLITQREVLDYWERRGGRG